MIITAMLISGAVAGLVGHADPASASRYSYGSTFQSGLGFAGIAVALLGRNNPIGIAIGALLFAYLNEQSNPLQIVVGVSPDIVAITQGVDRADRGHLLRGRPALRRPARAAGGRPSSRAASGEEVAGMSVPATATGLVEPPRRHRDQAPAAALLACSTSVIARPDAAVGARAGHRRRRPDLVAARSRATLIATMPIMLAGLGGLWSERAGVVNIGLEGMMILGTFGAGYFGYHYGAWAGVARRDRHGHARRPPPRHRHGDSSASTTSSPAWRSTSSRWARCSTSPSLTFAGLPGGGHDPVAQDPRRPGAHDRRRSATRSRRSRRRTSSSSPTSRRCGGRWSPTCRPSSSSRCCSWWLTWWILWRTSFGLRLRSCGESAVRGRVAGRGRAALQVRRGADLRRAGRPRAAASWRWSRRATTATARPAAAATSAWPR